ncbi:response regulator [Rhizobium sp. NFR03]|uniref:response regulator n=1 Tax=Rhizobium sp. NFR03 TaxID=1566263 RepID=UPI000B855154|nr:response regulator [Rhizobium sp. NFR03]
MEHPLLLVVEDEALLHIFLEDVLEGSGYTVSVQSTVDGALKALDADISRFSGLITDIRLGDRKMTGWDVARHARELCPTLPVVYMTADSSHEWAAYGVPGSVLLGKPFAEAQLVTAISQLLNAQLPG